MPVKGALRLRTAELLPPLQLCLSEWLLALSPGTHPSLVATSLRILSLLAEATIETFDHVRTVVEELKAVVDTDDQRREIIKDHSISIMEEDPVLSAEVVSSCCPCIC